MKPQPLKVRVQPYLPKLKNRQLTNREVAHALGVAEEHLCRTLKNLGFERDAPPDRSKQQELVKARKDHQKALAASKLTPAQAAQAAGCSERTIYRLRQK